jgi:hypothetical protein
MIDKCWKCGKELTPENRSEVIYTSNPPKYTCKSCDSTSFLAFCKPLADHEKQPKEVWFFYYNEERTSFGGDWSVVTRRSAYYPTFEEAWEAKENEERNAAYSGSCLQVLGPILKGYIKED